MLDPGESCWRIEQAERVGVLIDNQAYFAAVKQAIEAAQHSILIVGWCFDPRTRLRPAADDTGEAEELGALLDRRTRECPDLQVCILIWDMALPISIARSLSPQRARRWFRHSRCCYELDAAPRGACHHQKLVVVDDRLAFCSGGDFAANRWDRPEHLGADPCRTTPSGDACPPWHDVSMMVEGPVAAALGDLIRARWQDDGSREPLRRPPPRTDPIWPDHTVGEMRDVAVGVSLTTPVKSIAEIRQGLNLHVRAIRRARDCIYLENQYFTSLTVAEALARRLREPHGPYVIIILPREAPGIADGLMNRGRAPLIDFLRSNDLHGRLTVRSPQTADGRPIVVHSKMAIADDWLLRVGSMNISNRSFGLDTECDLAVEARAPGAANHRNAIRRVRDASLAHFLGCSTAAFTAEAAGPGGPFGAIDRLDPAGARLPPLPQWNYGIVSRLIAEYEIGDPPTLHDVFRPWRRKQQRSESLAGLFAQ